MKMRLPRLLTWTTLAAGVVLLTCVFAACAADEAAEEGDAKPAADADRPRVAPDAPVSPGGVVPLPRAPLLKENSRLIDVEGLILDMRDDLKVSPVHRAVFQPKDGLGYFVLLENALLEKTLRQTAHGERAVRVRGTVTLCSGKNYLLLDWAAVKQE